ncbi:MAG TPA: transketolase [Spirochaetota bacterium]|nr:transketolase [Spirochaetota bacterium]HSA15816.1 transketolase [Spirochaetota bacterium]
MPVRDEDLRKIANTIRTLSMDAVQKANSGHPGMPMGCADMGAVLWAEFLVHNPDDPGWINRDRFVLSAGHGSMLLYSLLHLSGYGLTLDDIRNFRQLHSRTPGHPEHYVTPGVETTTGPLGQGFANGVGMAMASKYLSDRFNANGPVIDHTVYAIVSDGDLMEGISSEAASLAGHLGLGSIVYLYDSNDISIEGSTGLTFSDDVKMRFEACKWHVQKIDGHNYAEIRAAITAAKNEKLRPSLIIARTRIAKGSPNLEGSEASHGAPLGEKEVGLAKRALECGDDCFAVAPGAYDIFERRRAELKKIYDSWKSEFASRVTGEIKKEWDAFFTRPDIDSLRPKTGFDTAKPMATRAASGVMLEKLFALVPGLIGGSADLGPSNKTFIKGYGESGAGKMGRNIHFGIREHAMGAIQNGMAYYGGIIPFSATFFVFMDYMRPPMRIAALGGLQTIYVFTHDSIFVGEDGPTHQPVEHLAAARAIPNLTVIRPADADETREAWLYALARNNGPTMLALTRQNLPPVCGEKAAGLWKGAYVVRDEPNPDIVVYSSGSEVALSLQAADLLKSRGIKARVVSFASWEIFDGQPEEYRNSILSHGKPAAVVEAGLSMGWERYAGSNALFITMKGFGTSAPAEVLAEEYGFTPEKVSAEIEAHVKKA